MWILENMKDGKLCIIQILSFFYPALFSNADFYMELYQLFTDGTLQELSENLRNATAEMKKADCSTTSVQSGCELFQRFITLAALDRPVRHCSLILLSTYLIHYILGFQGM